MRRLPIAIDIDGLAQHGFDARAAETRSRGRLRGRGITTFLEWTGAEVFTERVTVTGSPDVPPLAPLLTARQALRAELDNVEARATLDVMLRGA